MTFAGSLWALSRPRLMPYVALLPLVGFGWAHWDRALTLVPGRAVLWVVLAWLVLNAGTLWLNAAVDKDEGEVLMGRSVPPPPGTARAGYAALVAAVGLGFLGGPVSGACVVLCAVLSVLYSHPATLWKGHPFFGPFTNVVGYGLLSPLAGWSVVGVEPNLRTGIMWGLGALGLLGCYFAAQAFQQREDAERGYRTLVVTHGPTFTLWVARTCIAVGFTAAVALTAAGWLPRVCLLAVPLWLWVDRLFARWIRRPDGGTERFARALAGRMLASGLAVVALVLGVYLGEVARGAPVAGLGTAAGHPGDRPLLGPRAMRQWERAQQGRAGRDS